MNKLLIISDKEQNLSFVEEEYDFITIRKESDQGLLIDVYNEDQERSQLLRKEIESYQASRILVIGEMGEYKWLATVITSLFAKFNAWLGQYEQDYAKTVLNIKGKETPLLAIQSVDDYKIYKEWENV